MRITLFGLGLIGGSLALAWRRGKEGDLHVTGVDRPETLSTAISRGMIDEAVEDPQMAVKEADVVVLATPIVASLHLIESIGPHLKRGALVTDTCSVKLPLMRRAAEFLPEEVVFVGGHPMAGAERPGIEHANGLLFENATYVLTLPDGLGRSWEETIAPVVTLVRRTGARPLIIGADRHDRVAASVSHLPQLLATALMNVTSDLHREDPAFLQLAAGGFRDMTRIAASPFELWEQIIAANEDPILDALARYAANLQAIRNRLIEGDYESLRELFDRAASARNGIPPNMKGFLSPLADVMVNAEDRPGFLMRIVAAISGAGLDIKDLELLKVREGSEGTFRVAFKTPEDAESAVRMLKEAGLTAWLR
jgi:prephenate dehydrogenase